MSAPFVAEIRIFSCNFAPTGWAQCNGQLLSITQNTALFSLLGTKFGGDGKSTFGLPSLQGAVAIGQGSGAGLSPYTIGDSGGTDNVTLLSSEMPKHAHSVQANINPGNLAAPSPARSFARSSPGNAYNDSNANFTQFAPQAIAPKGNSQPHNNMQPYLVLNYCIALQGIYPARP